MSQINTNAGLFAKILTRYKQKKKLIRIKNMCVLFRFNSETNGTSSQIAPSHASAIFERVPFVSELKQKTI